MTRTEAGRVGAAGRAMALAACLPLWCIASPAPAQERGAGSVVLGVEDEAPEAVSQPPAAVEVRRADLVVLAPRTGRWRSVGRGVERAVRVALQTSPELVVEYVDTAEDPLAAAVAAAALHPRVVLGPVGVEETRAVVDAELIDAPLFVLSPERGIEDPARRVYRLRTAASEQAAALAELLIDEEFSGRVAIVAPDDDWGRDAVAGFTATAEDGAYTVSATVLFDAGERDARDAIQQLTGRRALRLDGTSSPWTRGPAVERGSYGGRARRPDVVVLAAWADEVADMLPFLAYRGWIEEGTSRGARLLGTSGWAAVEMEFAADLAAGAQFTRIFADSDLRGGAEAFAHEYEMMWSERPSEFEAQVFDGATMLLDALARSPQAVDETIRSGRGHDGVCGAFSLSPAGAPLRAPALWTVGADGRPVFDRSLAPASVHIDPLTE